MTAVSFRALEWPSEYERRWPGRVIGACRYSTTFDRALAHVELQLRRLGTSSLVVTSGMRLGARGIPLAREGDKQLPDNQDPGVAVYFEQGGRPCVMACDRWGAYAHNLRAIGLTLECMAGIERAGSSHLMARAFTGFAALPSAPRQDEPWESILGVDASAPVSEIRRAYHRRAREWHPDMGGSNDAMSALHAALDAAMRARKSVNK